MSDPTDPTPDTRAFSSAARATTPIAPTSVSPSIEVEPVQAPAGTPAKSVHPVRGLLWGLMFGIGLAVVAVVTTIIDLDLLQALLVAAVGTVVGVLWSIFGPAKGPPPAATSQSG